MENKVIFYVTRHGQTLFNVLDRVQGWSDTPLTQEGIETARLLGEGMKEINFAAAYSSDSGRAVETATLILGHSGQEQINIHHDERLREWCFGSMEGKSNKSFLDAILQGVQLDIGIEELNYYLENIAEIIVKSDSSEWAENFYTIKTRIKAVFEDIAEKISSNGGGNVLVVTHAFTIKTLIYLFANHRMEEAGKIKNASITKIIYQKGRFDVEYINNTNCFDYGKKTSEQL